MKDQEERTEGIEAGRRVECACGCSLALTEADLGLVAHVFDDWRSTHLGHGWQHTSFATFEELPRSWSLPPEPGPEVTHIRDRAGTIWRRNEYHAGHWSVGTDPGRGGATHWRDFLLLGPLVDATQDTTP